MGRPFNSWAWLPGVAFLLGAALALHAYSRGLPGDFVFDDGPAIAKNPAVQITSLDAETLWSAAWSGNSGPLKRPLSMLSFALNHYVSGLQPGAYKFTNMLVHAVNGAGLSLLAFMLLGAPRLAPLELQQRRWIAVTVGLLWILHPLHVTSVLYAVQRMTGLASLFMIGGLLSYVYGRTRQLRGQSGVAFILAAVFAFLPAAALAKENGVLLLPYLLVIELCLFNFAAANATNRRRVVLLVGLAVILPIATGVLYLAAQPGLWIDGYGGREFTLSERLLTEARVLLWYLRLILLPDVRQMGLHLDDFVLSRGLLAPVSTLSAVAAVVALLLLAVVAVRRWPLLAFAILWFFAGHSMESTVIPLEIAYEHRNYLPSFGILFAVVAYLHRLAIGAAWTRAGISLVIVYLAFLSIGLHIRASAWSSEFALAQAAVDNHPHSPRSHWFLATTRLDAAKTAGGEDLAQHLAVARRHFMRAVELKPNMVTSMVLLLYLDEKYGKGASPELIDRIATSLGQGVLSSSTLNSLWFLTDCQVLKSCRLSPDDFLKIMFSAVRNDRLAPAGRSRLLQYISIFFGRDLGDHALALFYAERAIEESPFRKAPHYTKIEWLAHIGQFDRALEVTDTIERLDTLGSQSGKLKELRAVLKTRTAPFRGERTL